MEKNKKAFLLTGVLVLILTALDVIKIIAFDLFGMVKEAILSNDMSVEERNESVVGIWIAFAIIAIVYLLHVYIGIKAIRISKKPTDGKSHIIIATFCLIFNIAGLIANITVFELMIFLLSLSSTIVMLLYVYEARNIRKMVIMSKNEQPEATEE